MRLRLTIVVSALALAGCGRPDANEAAANNASVAHAAGPKVDYVAELRSMAPALRRGAFLRAIRDAGQDCQEVVKEYETEPVNGQASWSAECGNGAQWIVIVERNGDAKVTNAVNPKPLAPAGAAEAAKGGASGR